MYYYNIGFVILCVTLSLLSFLCSGFTVLAHFKIPQLLKHPGSLVVIICITQMLFDLHWLTTIPAIWNKINDDDTCSKVAIANGIWFFSTWNIVTSLSLELIVKIKFPLNTAYTFRIKIYLIATVIITALENLFIYYIGAPGPSRLDTCAIKTNSLAEYAYCIILFGNLPIMWVSIFIVLRNSAAKNNKALKSLTLVIFSLTITWGMPTFSSLLRKFFGNYNIYFDYFSMICGSSSGIFITICRLASPQLAAKIAEVLCQKSKKIKANKIELNDKKALLNHISLNSFFESITEVTIQDILYGLSLVCLAKGCSKIHYSYSYKKQKYLFKNDDFASLTQYARINIQKIKDIGIWEYEPEIFSLIRENCNMNADQIIKSICTEQNFHSTQNFNTGGRSNAFIFSTHDENILIKTVTREEKYFLLGILQAYSKRIINHPESKIVRILGLYKMRSNHKVCFVLMENILRKKNQALIFDLKGSIDNRFVKSNREILGSVFKDKNFFDMGKRIEIGSEKRNEIINALIDDSIFFKKLNIIDYSLLVGFYSEKNSYGSRYYTDGLQGNSYCIGVIDFLQDYTFRKKLELIFKRVKGKVNTSVCSPSIYSERFIKFIKGIFI
ncbi:hypothetical protein SteCoe_23487 [Stentor coeruleus]|uniref:PIPK domain-containing protein n=1 Tax=Stentor coeruleus TaxID=5963 RepID=A0A1R2BJS0_9CILI|nr:hypothetical protein SteCoe_23487 [Stentor coeruleus]